MNKAQLIQQINERAAREKQEADEDLDLNERRAYLHQGMRQGLLMAVSMLDNLEELDIRMVLAELGSIQEMYQDYGQAAAGSAIYFAIKTLKEKFDAKAE